MSARRGRELALVVMAGFVLAACGRHDREIRTGEIVSETREVRSFDSVEVEGTAKVEIRVGSPESVVLEGGELFVRRTTTEVRGDTLHIEGRRRDWIWINGEPRVTVRITVPHLASLKLEGGNNVQLSGFNGGESRIRVAGAAHIRAEGRIDELDVDMAGAGYADFSRLVATDATVKVDGVGSVIVHPTGTLDATMNGVGAILYTGTPREVNTRMNGLGTIRKRSAGEERQADAEPGIEVDPNTLEPERGDRPPRSPPKLEDLESTEVI